MDLESRAMFGRTRKRFRLVYNFWLSLRYSASALELVNDMTSRAKEIENTSQYLMFNAIGSALSGWAQMEGTVVSILSLLLRTPSQKAGLVLYSIINFNVWLSIIDELLTVDDKLASFKPRWNKISARLRSAKDDRDRLAHNYVKKGNAKLASELPVTLNVPHFDHRQKQQKFSPMTIEQIQQFNKATLAIFKDLSVLMVDMGKEIGIPQLGALPDKSFGPDRDQRH
jgi:hypothetical protein